MTNDEGQMTKEIRMTNDEHSRTNYGLNSREADSEDAEAAFWGIQGAAGALHDEGNGKRVYDLEERTALFGEAIIEFAKTIPQNPVTNRIITQLVGAGTSVDANYLEADDAISKKEFLKNIGTCKKEVREVKHFLRMAVRAVPEVKPKARSLWLEARELHLIFSKIWRSGKNES